MQGLGRLLIFAGVFIVILGVCVLLAQKLGLPLGRLPGEFLEGQAFFCLFPAGDLPAAQRDSFVGSICSESPSPLTAGRPLRVQELTTERDARRRDARLIVAIPGDCVSRFDPMMNRMFAVELRIPA